jgi:serine/threonine protein phosphatase PrpC
MQGWRKRMEDSHISDLSLNSDPKLNVFGVFDGHGGSLKIKYRKGSSCICKETFH